MNLWIRSQDKDSLMKIDNINLGYQNDENNQTLNEARRLFTFKNNTSFTLGVYKTEERALEVLDEIQSKLDIFNKFIDEPKDMLKNFFVPPTYIYKMPEE